MQAPIGPATTPELVSAVTSTGALGTLAASWTKPEKLQRQLRAIRAAAGVNYCVTKRKVLSQSSANRAMPNRSRA